MLKGPLPKTLEAFAADVDNFLDWSQEDFDALNLLDKDASDILRTGHHIHHNVPQEMLDIDHVGDPACGVPGCVHGHGECLGLDIMGASHRLTYHYTPEIRTLCSSLAVRTQYGYSPADTPQQAAQDCLLCVKRAWKRRGLIGGGDE